MTIEELRKLLAYHEGDLDVKVVLRAADLILNEERIFDIVPDPVTTDSWEPGYSTILFLSIEEKN